MTDSDGLREAIKKGMQAAGWKQPSDDTLRQIETAVNNYLGDAANDGEKTQRLEVAVSDIGTMFVGLRPISAGLIEQVRSIIEKAQG